MEHLAACVLGRREGQELLTEIELTIRKSLHMSDHEAKQEICAVLAILPSCTQRLMMGLFAVRVRSCAVHGEDEVGCIFEQGRLQCLQEIHLMTEIKSDLLEELYAKDWTLPTLDERVQDFHVYDRLRNR